MGLLPQSREWSHAAERGQSAATVTPRDFLGLERLASAVKFEVRDQVLLTRGGRRMYPAVSGRRF
jgi:hypothetical protein